MPRIVLATALSVVVGLTAVIARQPDFSGTWTLDRDASQISQFGGGRGGVVAAARWAWQRPNNSSSPRRWPS